MVFRNPQVANDGLVPELPGDMVADSTRPAWLPGAFVSLVQKCLQRDPKQRPSTNEISAVLKQY